MSQSEKHQARRLSEYVDGMIARSRAEESGPCDNDPSLGELANLAADLSELRFLIPKTLHENVLRRISHEAQKAETRNESHSFRAISHFRWQPASFHVPLGLACTIVLAFTAWFSKTIPVSAATVLARSQTALANLAGPGEVLHRKWLLSSQSSCAVARHDPVSIGMLDEWLDANGKIRSAERSTRADGTLRWAYTTGGPENRHLVYFPPSAANPAGLLSIEPTTEEYYAAIQSFPPDRQPIIRAYLDRGYLVEPVLSDQQFNWRAISDRSDNIEELPRVMLTMEKGTRKDGDPYFRVGIAEDRRPWFWWTAQGKPAVWLERQQTVRFISVDTYLSWRNETVRTDEQGCQLISVRDLVADERIKEGAAGSDMFALNVPAGTQVRHQSAADLLASILQALEKTVESGPRRSLEQ